MVLRRDEVGHSRTRPSGAYVLISNSFVSMFGSVSFSLDDVLTESSFGPANFADASEKCVFCD